MANEILMTKEGYEQLRSELSDLKLVKRDEIAERIRVARGFGDLSENSEYDEAKNEQAVLESRILQLEEQLKNTKILDISELKTDVISVGSKIKIYDTAFEEEMEYRIVSAVEANKTMDTITDESPVGKALIGHKVGDLVDVQVPAGTIQFKVLEISI